MDSKKTNKTIDYGLIRAFAHAVEWAVKKYNCDPVSFITGCLDLAQLSRFADDCSLYTQSSSCIAGRMLEKMNSKGKNVAQTSSTDESKLLDEEDGYWLGYIVMYWMLQEGVTEKDLIKYDWGLTREAYDILHTTSPQYTIDFIKKEYKTVISS